MRHLITRGHEGAVMAPQGLSNKAQSYWTLASGLLIIVGAVSVPSGLSPYLSFGLMLCGVIGLGIKEWLGDLSSAPS